MGTTMCETRTTDQALYLNTFCWLRNCYRLTTKNRILLVPIPDIPMVCPDTYIPELHGNQGPISTRAYNKMVKILTIVHQHTESNKVKLLFLQYWTGVLSLQTMSLQPQSLRKEKRF